MSNQTDTQNTNNGNAKPDWVCKTREGHGKNVSFDTVGAAWTREDGGIYFKPYGKQLIDSPIYFFKVKQQES